MADEQKDNSVGLEALRLMNLISIQLREADRKLTTIRTVLLMDDSSGPAINYIRSLMDIPIVEEEDDS